MKAPVQLQSKKIIINEVLYCKDDRTHVYWRPLLPRNLEHRVIDFVLTLLGHQGTDKCMCQMSDSFLYLKDLGWNMRKYVAYCGIHHRAKHPNRAHVIERKSHLPTKPAELRNWDFYGPHLTGYGGVGYLLIFLDVRSKRVQLYPLKSATTLSCLSDLKTQYFEEIITPRPSYLIMALNSHAHVVGKHFPSWDLKRSIHPSDTPRISPPSVWCRVGEILQSWLPQRSENGSELGPYITDWLHSSASELLDIP
jgi:hypothetical protein